MRQMNTSGEQVRRLIAQRAADWFVANREALTPEQRQSFTDWLKTSPVHVEEYLAITDIGRDMREACSASAQSIEALVARARSEADSMVETLHPRADSIPSSRFSWSWQSVAIVFSMGLLVTVGLISLFNSILTGVGKVSPEVVATLHYRTEHGQQKTYVLADNSVVHLNTDSEIAIRYTRTQRAVSLTSGEAAFEVVHQGDRPFRVTAKSADIVDVGTQFNVRLINATTVVTVMEGRVEVMSASSAQKDAGLQVAAGGQVSVTDGVLPTHPASADTARTTAWLHRQISFDRERLDQVAAEFNRYAQKSIVITTPALRSLQVSGVFATDDTAVFVAFLRSLEGVRVEETASQFVVSRQNVPRGTH
jgi:transmembrane sensor